MDKNKCVMPDDLAVSQAAFHAERANIIAKNAVSSVGIRAAARTPEGVAANAMSWDLEVTQGERTDQKRSGRCWMFASLNTFRYRTIKKYNLKTFEFSQAYPLFFDKLEKSNWFLENILDTLDEPLHGRLVSYLLMDPVGDGGQWDMFRALTKKYGAVPKEAMPETACSSNTREMDKYLTRYLRSCAKLLRDSAEAGVRGDLMVAMKKHMMDEVYHLLVTCLGEPPAAVGPDARRRAGCTRATRGGPRRAGAGPAAAGEPGAGGGDGGVRRAAGLDGEGLPAVPPGAAVGQRHGAAPDGAALQHGDVPRGGGAPARRPGG